MSSTQGSGAAAARLYGGLWTILVRWLKVPAGPPSIPALGPVESVRPAPAFLKYLKLWYWISSGSIVFVLLAAWIGATIALWWLGMILAAPFLALAACIVIPGFVAIHLRFDSTWYVITDRSMRIRRGLWTIEETTITFENVQDLSVNQGPVQRYFGIADLVVRTAGGGIAAGGKHGGGAGAGHVGLLEGLADAPRIRDLVSARLQRSVSAGLGDEAHHPPHASNAFTPDHIAELRAIRDALAAR